VCIHKCQTNDNPTEYNCKISRQKTALTDTLKHTQAVSSANMVQCLALLVHASTDSWCNSQQLSLLLSNENAGGNTWVATRYLTVLFVPSSFISFPSPTHSFIPGLKPSFFCKSLPQQTFLFFFRTDCMDSPDFYFYFWAYPFLLFSFSVLHFLVVVSVW